MIEYKDQGLVREFSASLGLVSSEIKVSMDNASTKLERYADSHDDTHIREFLKEINQLRGTFKMLNFRAGERLCEEVVELIRTKINTEIPDSYLIVCDKSLATLARYIELLLDNQPVAPSLLIPSINAMRLKMGAKKLPDGYFFSVNLRPRYKMPDPKAVDSVPYRAIRRVVQKSILEVITKQNTEYLSVMRKALNKVEAKSIGFPSWPFWNLVLAGLDALTQPGFEISQQRISMLGYIDRQIKKLIDTDGTSFREKLPDWVMKEFLYVIALSETTTPRIEQVKRTYMIDGFLTAVQLQEARRKLDGPDKRAILSLAREINEEIQLLKDLIDVKRLDSNESILHILLQHLRRIENALIIAEKNELSGYVRELIIDLEAERVPLNDLAERIIELEMDVRAISLSTQPGGEFSIDPIILKEAKIALMSVSVESLVKIKHTATSFINTGDDSKVAAIAKGLGEIAGIAAFMNKRELHDVLEQLEKFVVDQFTRSELFDQPKLLDSFAEAVTAVEYYLDVIGSSAIMASEALTMARKSTKSLF